MGVRWQEQREQTPIRPKGTRAMLRRSHLQDGPAPQLAPARFVHRAKFARSDEAWQIKVARHELHLFSSVDLLDRKRLDAKSFIQMRPYARLARSILRREVLYVTSFSCIVCIVRVETEQPSARKMKDPDFDARNLHQRNTDFTPNPLSPTVKQSKIPDNVANRLLCAPCLQKSSSLSHSRAEGLS